MAIGNRGLSVISAEVTEKLAKKNISPSMVTSLGNCPAQWAAGSFVLPSLLPQDDDNAASRGSLFHKVMEVFFDREPENRPRTDIPAIIDDVLETEEFALFKDNEDALRWLDNAIDGYYRMGGRPEKVRIANYKRAGEEVERKGLEVFVKGKIGNTERNCLGFIDRLAEDHRVEDGVIIEDWKSGAKAKVWNPKTKSTDGQAEARQQVMYSMLLKDEGVNVTGARLIYPVAEKVVPVTIDDPDFNARVIEDVENTDKALTTMIENNEFEYRPNVLCSWCSISRLCPRAKIGNFPKAREAARKQPGIEVLAPGFDFI